MKYFDLFIHLQRLKELIGAHYITPSKDFRVLSGELLCRDKMPTQIICANLLLLVMGFDSDQLNSVRTNLTIFF